MDEFALPIAQANWLAARWVGNETNALAMTLPYGRLNADKFNQQLRECVVEEMIALAEAFHHINLTPGN